MYFFIIFLQITSRCNLKESRNSAAPPPHWQNLTVPLIGKIPKFAIPDQDMDSIPRHVMKELTSWQDTAAFKRAGSGSPSNECAESGWFPVPRKQIVVTRSPTTTLFSRGTGKKGLW